MGFPGKQGWRVGLLGGRGRWKGKADPRNAHSQTQPAQPHIRVMLGFLIHSLFEQSVCRAIWPCSQHAGWLAGCMMPGDAGKMDP